MSVDTRDTAQAAALAEICRRLDGIPLAIELAAARARLLPPIALLAHLDHPLDILTHGQRDHPTRHQTLRQTFDWSYDLLDDDDQRLFRHLGVFAGSFTLEQMARVCLVGSETPTTFFDCVDQLIESSLVRPAPKNSSGEIRLLLLEPIREYALEQLERSREADVARVRHALAYLELAERAAPEMNGPDQGAWLERLERDDGNLRVALRSLIDRGDVEGGLRFSAALSWFWWVRGHAREGLDQLREVLALHSVVPDNSSLAVLARRH